MDLERAKLQLARAQLDHALGTEETFEALLEAQEVAQRAARAEQQQRRAKVDAELKGISGPVLIGVANHEHEREGTK